MEPTIDASPRIARAYVLVTFVVMILWQCWTVSALFRFTPQFVELWQGLGAEVSPFTQAYIASYRLTALLPIVSAGIALDLRRRRPMPFKYAVVSFAVIALLTMAWTAFATEALYQPMFAVMGQIG